MKVNGSQWVSAKQSDSFLVDGDYLYGTLASVDGDTVLNVYSIRIIGTDTSGFLMNLRLKPGKTGTYTGTTNIDYGMVYVAKFDFASLIAAIGSNTTNYTVVISKFDASNKLVSGTFSFSMVPKSIGTTYTVTEGSFTDLKYTTE